MELTREHINYNLGISVPLNEYIILSKEIELRILHEQMLYESFLDSIKAFAKDKLNKVVTSITDWKDAALVLGKILSDSNFIKDFAKDKLNKVVTSITDWKDAALVLGKILSDSNLLNDFLKPLERRVLGLIKPLTDFLKKIKLDSFIEPITEFINKIKSLQGWKKFMALISLGSIITYILEKLKSPDAIKDFLKKQFTGDFVDTILNKLTDFKSYLGWLEPIVKGVEVIFNFLKPLTQAFSTALASGNQWATKLIRENTMKDRFQKLAGIKEEIKQDPSITSISSDLNDQGSNFKNINSKEKTEQLLDALVNKLDPKFKETSAFKQAIISFYNKYK